MFHNIKSWNSKSVIYWRFQCILEARTLSWEGTVSWRHKIYLLSGWEINNTVFMCVKHSVLVILDGFLTFIDFLWTDHLKLRRKTHFYFPATGLITEILILTICCNLKGTNIVFYFIFRRSARLWKKVSNAVCKSVFKLT